MKIIKSILQYIYSIYGFIIFVFVLLLIFPFVLISLLFGKTNSGNFVYILCRIWADIAFFLWGFHHKNIFEFPVNKQHACVYVFNHISYMDIPVLMKTFRNQNIRILAKASMGSIPIFGVLYRAAAIMVDRSSAKARANSIKELKDTLDKNISVVIAPEGTFNTTDCALKSFYDGAFKIAIETQTPIVPVIFPDNYNRMHY
ncbi:MAG: lysophospholipid acyltransferase family protein, partial [Ferruginibacter sp.]